ncbi:MAG: M20/M25/M40 family metallo-hydrolase, partial [Candidatus Thorarchaeota archaeon]
MDKISIEEVRETIEHLCSIENKIAGTEAEKKIAAYLKKRLSGYGLTNVKEEQFNVHLWNPVSCRLKVTKPNQKEIKAVVFPYSMSAKVKGPLVQFHINSPEVHKKNNGMIGITSWSDNLYLGPMRAYFHGIEQDAKAVIISSPAEGDLHKVIVISSGGLLKIPVINITKEDGEFLFKLLESGPVTAELELDVEYSEQGESQNLVTTIKGTTGSQEEIVVGAHYDAWFKGAADNSAPAAIVIELARLLNDYVANGGELKRNVRFLLFGAEESGSKDFYYWCNGSKAYVNNHNDKLKNMVAMLSLDSIGFPAPAQNYIGATSDLFKFIKEVKPEASGPKVEYYDPPGYGSDHWFFELAGVPTIYCVAFPSYLYHTQKDDPEHLDYDAVQFHAEFMKQALIQLANSEVVPLDIFRPLSIFQKILSHHSRLKDSPFDLSQLLSKISRLANRKKLFEKEAKRILEKGTTDEKNRVNRFLLSATRMMNETIGWIWRESPPNDIGYLARMELIADYADLNASIRALRSMPISNTGSHSAVKLNNQKENPYNWIKVHKPLAMLERERSKIFHEIESEISRLMKLLDSIDSG